MKARVTTPPKTFLLLLIPVFLALFFRSLPKQLSDEPSVVVRDFLVFTEEITSYPAKVTFIKNSKRIGISSDVDKIDFGIVATGTKVRKKIFLFNNNPCSVRVYIIPRGSIAEVVEAERSFTLRPFENKTVELTAFSLKEGNYTGEIEVLIRKPRFGWLTWLI